MRRIALKVDESLVGHERLVTDSAGPVAERRVARVRRPTAAPQRAPAHEWRRAPPIPPHLAEGSRFPPRGRGTPPNSRAPSEQVRTLMQNAYAIAALRHLHGYTSTTAR